MSDDGIPEGPEFSEAWQRLDRDARRRVRRAANRGVAADDPREAALAVTVARGQQRFWRWGWLLGPVLAALLGVVAGATTIETVGNAIFATILFAGLGYFFMRRARRAEQVNREAAATRKKRKGGGGGGKKKRGKQSRKR